jgi:hypothetical protein
MDETALRASWDKSAAAWGAAEGGRRMSRGYMAAIVALCIVTAVVITIVPLLLPKLPEPAAIRLDDMGGQVSGYYVQSAGTLFKIYPYLEMPKKLPSGAPVVQSGADLLVRSRALDTTSARYTLSTFPALERVPVTMKRVDGHTVQLVPRQALPAGTYVLEAPRDSVDPAWCYVCFRVVD